MEVTIYKKGDDVSNGFVRSAKYCLDRIKNGKSKEKVLWLRTLDSSEYSKHKMSLPAVCFNGEFKYRSLAGIVKHSGLIILDFDKFKTDKEVLEFKDSICDDKYVYAAWVSPSGLGLKVLVKIPADIENHKAYFNGLREYYNHPNWDNSGSDLPRLCFESYDPDLYINEKSVTFTDLFEPESHEIGSKEVSISIKSDNLIISNLLKWFESKYPLSKGNRNNNLFILASALNDFGIDKSVSEHTLLAFETVDFDKNEILNILKSAYKKTSSFGTKFFEDKDLKIKIEKQIKNGKSKKEVLDSYPEQSKKDIESCINDIKENSSITDFWYFDDKGKISLSPHQFKYWLEQNNFFKFFPADNNTFTFVKIEQNLVEETNEKRIKDFVLKYLLDRKDIGYTPYDFMASSSKYFSIDFLSFLESFDIKMKEDNQDECFIYFKNNVVKITKDSITEIDYIDLDGYVWKRQIIDRDFKHFDHHFSEFRTFLWLISGKDVEKYESFKSVIGYLLHSFKNSANNKAIIFNDETISENPNGGSGKGLFWNALSQMKKVASIDGKTFEFTKSFPYQTVSTDTQLLVFDDVKKNFNFESLFSLITEGITLEYKGQDAIKLPVHKSPKILITTNYTVGGVGGSFERRKFEVEMSDYFNYKHTPLDEFGHLLFEDWDDLEWLRFDNFMINCVQFYLKNGLTKHDFKNLEVRKFIKNTSFEFYEWSKLDDNGFNENIGFNVRHEKRLVYDQFLNEYPDFRQYKLSQKRFKHWLEAYCSFYEFEYIEGNTNGQRWFLIKTNNEINNNDNLDF